MKKIFAVILCAVISLSFVACSSTSDKAATNEISDSRFDYFAAEDAENGNYFVADSASGATAPESAKENSDEKIIKTVELTVETKEYEAYISALTASVKSAGGYIENSTANLGRYDYSNRYATYTVRIPAANLEAFINASDEKGTIISKTENQQNVTLEYVDLESRIEAYKTERSTLTGLLEKAESLEDVLKIQERLSEVNYQIETYTSQLKVLENRVSYSTVTLHISEVERVTETQPTLWSRIKNRFLSNLDNLVDWLKEMIVSVIGGLPVIIPLSAAVFVAILIIKKIIKKRRGH